MASQIAHILTGRAALRLAFPETHESMLGEYSPWFNLGCQGPDLFYHNQRTRPLAISYGSLVHRRLWASVTAALSARRPPKQLKELWRAFVLGWASHGPLDRLSHPFIVYRSGWADPARPETRALVGSHPFYERLLDVLAWERASGTSISAFRQEDELVPTGGLPDGVATLVAQALRDAYPEKTNTDSQLDERCANAFTDSFGVYRFSSPSATSLDNAQGAAWLRSLEKKGVRTLGIVFPEGFDRSIDWANEAGSLWRNPCPPDRPSRQSFYQIMEEAAGTAALAMRSLYDAMENDQTIDTALLGGEATLNVGDASGTQARPEFMDPLPLAKAMEQQMAMRLGSSSL